MQTALNQEVTFRLNKGGEKKKNDGILEKTKAAFQKSVKESFDLKVIKSKLKKGSPFSVCFNI